jgi:hypothetical protein
MCVVGATLGAGAASEIANVSHVFQPSGRFLAPNSKYDFASRKPCISFKGKIYPSCGPAAKTRVVIADRNISGDVGHEIIDSGIPLQRRQRIEVAETRDRLWHT